ncbi:hypothetical protein LAZ67_7002217 [Cordylochernes scorpioides]|uniref:Helix-turn-helix domain-containing protein n=1 Tax=Cordylochernes scorpioides TaxID=51811 RepID=A0ABY6KT03_9ARAC|nr:hypothetical protein LAZ67_7002217 [Cordylochernes scorpioides]
MRQTIFWRRYIDDIFCICSKDKVKSILDTLNSYNPEISFTLESENNNVLPFLDILIIRTPTKFHTTVLYKKHMNPSYTHYTSFCPISHKITVVKTLTKRIFTHCSLPCFKTIEQTNITNHLTALGYPISFIHRHSFNPNFSRQPKTYRTHCTIPYSKVNTTIAHKLNKYGETSRTIDTRLKEHERNIRYKDNRSLIYQHTSTTGHTFNLKQAIAHYQDIERKQQRLFLEALRDSPADAIRKERAERAVGLKEVCEPGGHNSVVRSRLVTSRSAAEKTAASYLRGVWMILQGGVVQTACIHHRKKGTIDRAPILQAAQHPTTTSRSDYVDFEKISMLILYRGNQVLEYLKMYSLMTSVRLVDNYEQN